MIYYLLEIYSGILNIRHIRRFYYLIYNYIIGGFMRTKLTELLNIEYPIIQGAMAWVSEANGPK